MIKNYFRIALRSISRHKMTAAINVLGLALGITACLIIYLDTSFELSYDNFHPGKESIFRVVTKFIQKSGEINYKPAVPIPVAAEIRSTFTGIEAVTQFHSYYARVSVPGAGTTTKNFDAANERKEENSDIVITDPAYFDIFHYNWIAGNAASMKEPFHVVLTESKAAKYFGAVLPDKIIGREIVYDDSLRLFVSGVVKDFPLNSDFSFKDFISAATIQPSFLQNKFNFANWQRWNKVSQTFVRTAKNTTTPQFEKQTLGMVKANMDIGKDVYPAITLQPLSDVHFDTRYPAAYGRVVRLPVLYGLMAIALFILVIAVVNFINLSTAQSLQRAKEVGVRKVLGSSRAGLIFQFLCETLLLTTIALVLSMLMTPPLIKVFQGFLAAGVVLSAAPSTISFIVLILLLTALFAGFYPAKILSSYAPVHTLKGANFNQGHGKIYLRKGLIVFQFTISLVFIIATLVIGKQLHYALSTDMGFVKDAIVNIPASPNYPKDKMKILAQQIKQLPEVAMVSIDLGTPAEKSHWSTILKSKEMGETEVGSQFQAGDENYIPLFGLHLLAGRNLVPCDTMKEYLINETLSRQLGFKNPEEAIGKTISGGGDDGTATHKQLPIVGVLADFHSQSLHEAIAPTFISTSKKYSRMISVKLRLQENRLGNIKGPVAKMEKIWKTVYPHEKFDYQFFDDTIAAFYETEAKTVQLMNTAMAIAIFISCMGLFGLASFAAQKRTKEIGIRKVLGADVSGIVAMLSLDFIKLIGIAFLIAAPLAYFFMYRWLQDFAYRTTISWWIFVAAGASAVFIALVTISFQAVKAATANPVKSLRTE